MDLVSLGGGAAVYSAFQPFSARGLKLARVVPFSTRSVPPSHRSRRGFGRAIGLALVSIANRRRHARSGRLGGGSSRGVRLRHRGSGAAAPHVLLAPGGWPARG